MWTKPLQGHCSPVTCCKTVFCAHIEASQCWNVTDTNGLLDVRAQSGSSASAARCGPTSDYSQTVSLGPAPLTHHFLLLVCLAGFQAGFLAQHLFPSMMRMESTAALEDEFASPAAHQQGRQL